MEEGAGGALCEPARPSPLRMDPGPRNGPHSAEFWPRRGHECGVRLWEGSGAFL